ESGFNLAMYYLVNPTRIPGSANQTYWSGTAGADVAMGSNLSGTINVAVTPTGNDGRTYEITSIGKTPAPDSITRTFKARVQSNKYVVRHAAVFPSTVTLPSNMTIAGDVATNGKLTIPTSGTCVVNGKGYCNTY